MSDITPYAQYHQNAKASTNAMTGTTGRWMASFPCDHDDPCKDGRDYFGPFATKSDAEAWVYSKMH